MRTLALVVPSLLEGGGVPAVARFVADAAERSGRYQVVPISLATSMDDATSSRLRTPRTWRSGPGAASIQWDGRPAVHVGAVIAELEFQRYRPRSALTRRLVGCDLVQVVCGSPAWANAAVGCGRPVSVQVATRAVVERRRRDAAPHGIVDRWRACMTRVTDRLDDRALRRADAIQVENPWMLEYARALNHDRASVDIRYAPPGVNAAFFSPAGAPASPPYLLCVGRLNDPRKHPELLLAAFIAVARAMPEVCLVTAGLDGPGEAYWAMARAAGVAERVSHVARPSPEALRDLYRGATAFALPSDEEGLGIVVLEAMACGTPVVSTRSGGPEGVITDDVDGFLVERDDASAMAARLLDLLRDPARRAVMADAARATIAHRYAREVAGQAFVDVWDRLLERR